MENCIFCRIIKGNIPCKEIHQDENFLAFLDVNPCSKGHCLIVPKKHGEDIFDFEDEECEKIIPFTKKVMKMIKEKIGCNGFNVGWNNGKFAGQVVPHLHVHIIPRFEGDNGGSMHSIINNPGELKVEEVYSLFE